MSHHSFTFFFTRPAYRLGRYAMVPVMPVATKPKSGWGICGSSCCVVLFSCLVVGDRFALWYWPIELGTTFHCLCLFQNRATVHLRPNSREKNRTPCITELESSHIVNLRTELDHSAKILCNNFIDEMFTQLPSSCFVFCLVFICFLLFFGHSSSGLCTDRCPALFWVNCGGSVSWKW